MCRSSGSERPIPTEWGLTPMNKRTRIKIYFPPSHNEEHHLSLPYLRCPLALLRFTWRMVKWPDLRQGAAWWVAPPGWMYLNDMVGCSPHAAAAGPRLLLLLLFIAFFLRLQIQGSYCHVVHMPLLFVFTSHCKNQKLVDGSSSESLYIGSIEIRYCWWYSMFFLYKQIWNHQKQHKGLIHLL